MVSHIQYARYNMSTWAIVKRRMKTIYEIL